MTLGELVDDADRPPSTTDFNIPINNWESAMEERAILVEERKQLQNFINSTLGRLQKASQHAANLQSEVQYLKDLRNFDSVDSQEQSVKVKEISLTADVMDALNFFEVSCRGGLAVFAKIREHLKNEIALVQDPTVQQSLLADRPSRFVTHPANTTPASSQLNTQTQ